MAVKRYNEPLPPDLTEDEAWRWAATIYASKQPRGDAHWAAILDEMFHDISLYLQAMDIARNI